MQQVHSGRIELTIGPMFGGKTSELYKGVHRHLIAGRKCIIVTYQSDTRYDHLRKNGGIVAHSGFEYTGVQVLSALTLESIEDKLTEYDVIGVDEVQFYPDCHTVLQRLANSGKVVIAAGLDATSEGKPFGMVHNLIPLAESVVKLQAVCITCGVDASFSKAITTTSGVINIGGADKYRAACRKCMFNC